MAETPDALFARFRRDGDPDHLARVFDLTAPKLLRLAIHLAGEVSEAEDLVQATFLTAIERAASFDGSRDLEPWLAGILANHARAARRSEQRAPDLERLFAREQATPLEEAQRQELSGALAEALDSLPEPYRRTLTLRLRHGMKPGDIAHALGESPGAVRVRIHRGLEMLREKLPAGFVASAAFLVPGGRGLGAVKGIVVAKAAASVSAIGATGTIGGVILGKKLVAAGSTVMLVLAAIVGGKIWFGRSHGNPGSGGMPLARLENSEASKAPWMPDALDESASGAPAADRSSGLSSPLPGSHAFQGKVVDGDSGQALAGAHVQVYPSRKTRFPDFVSRWSDRIEVWRNGTISAPSDTWPWIPGNQADLMRSGSEEFEVCDPPLPGTPPMSEGETEANGEFTFPVVGRAAFVTCALPGYEARLVAPQDHDITIRMWKPKPLSGYLIDPEGHRIRERIRLRFTGTRKRGAEESSTSTAEDWAGQWIVETDADGAFDARFAADRVAAKSAQPDWTLTNIGIHPDNGHRWTFPTSFTPGMERGPALLVARHTPALIVVDAETNRPIESVSVYCRELANGYPCWSGRFVAPGGRLRLVENDPTTRARSSCDGHLRFVVWSDGHLPETLEVDDLANSNDLVVRLRVGEPSRLEGTIRDSSGPVEGATVSLNSFGKLQWGENDGWVIDAERTSGSGRFAFAIPEGTWLLRCSDEQRTRWLTVQVPTPGPVVVDFSVQTEAVVRVRDSLGRARSEHTVVLRGEDGRQFSKDTDSQGETVFSDLTAGSYRVFVPRQPTHSSFSGAYETQFDLVEGERKIVEVVVASAEPRFARVVTNRPVGFEGWRSRTSGKSEWLPLGSDGNVPIDLQGNVSGLDIESADARRWFAPIQPDVPDGYPIRIDLEGAGYEGSLRDRSSGEALAGVRVIASPIGSKIHGAVSVTSITGKGGDFRLPGLGDARYALSFEASEDRSHWSGRWNGVRFLPAALPSDPSSRLDIGVPRASSEGKAGYEGIQNHILSGHVRVAGSTRSGLALNVGSEFPQSDGSLWLYPESAWAQVDADGAYRVVLPLAPRHHAGIWDQASLKGYPPIDWDGSGSPPEEVRDFDLRE